MLVNNEKSKNHITTMQLLQEKKEIGAKLKGMNKPKRRVNWSHIFVAEKFQGSLWCFHDHFDKFWKFVLFNLFV